jgi:SAM-dependent methyltransferase
MFSSRKTLTATALYCLKASASTVRSTAASGSQVYESHRAVNEYLLAHFGASEDQMPYQFGPLDGTQFPLRLANLCVKHRDGLPKKRALDIGCAVGAASFHLTADFDEVVGIDFSQHFIDAANEMKSKRQMPYTILKQGDIFESRVAKMPEKTHPQKATFHQGDACNLSKEKIGTVHLYT